MRRSSHSAHRTCAAHRDCSEPKRSRPSFFSRKRSARRAFTLLEVMVATAVTLLMMVSLAQVFKIIGDSMKQGRAALELNNTLRSVTYRLRHDLNNLTIRVDPPADSSCGSGYFEYTDGAMTDFTCMLYDPNNGLNPDISTDTVRSSRIGDMDDILMYTVRAGDSWFTGKVPLFILNGAPPANAADLTMVTISAQHAEVAVFARPVDLNLDGLYDDTDSDDMPDGYKLFYRTLLIRPDLNLTTTGALPFLAGTNPWMVAFPQSGLPSPSLDMALAHQQCDLSLRRVFNPDTTVAYDQVAANSLEDLMDPANRFAHVQVPLTALSTTMPLLALDDGLPMLLSSATGTVPPYTNNSTVAGVGSGFLHSAFVLGQLSSSSVDDTRLGEDLFASEVVAFDVKGYDASVPVLGSNGVDSLPLFPAPAYSPASFGAAGSDDITLMPSDPGYAVALTSFPKAANTPSPVTVVGYGGYVDLMWGRKTLNALPYYGLDAQDLPDRIPIASTSLPEGHYLVSELSGYSFPLAAWNSTAAPNLNLLPFTSPLYRSGKAVRASSGAAPLVLQPTFDTWTTRYESDGILQAELDGNGIVRVNGRKALYNSALGTGDTANVKDTFRQAVPGGIDAGTDGIDNNGGGGADEITEQETSPPFPGKLNGVRVTVRMEDKATRQVKQMSVANEFITQ